MEALLKAWLNDEQQGARWANGQVDFAVTLADRQRLRGSAFKHMHGVSIALRLLPLTCPQLSALGVPRAIPELLSNDNGLILVTGATGSGKSTTGRDGRFPQSPDGRAYSDLGRSGGVYVPE